MEIYNNQAITESTTLTIPLTQILKQMLGHQSISLQIFLTGGETQVPADVTADLKFWADNYPREKGAAIDITKSAYRADAGKTIGDLAQTSVQSVGSTEEEAWVDFKDLNADEIEITVGFSAKPDAATPAKLLIKARKYPH